MAQKRTFLNLTNNEADALENKLWLFELPLYGVVMLCFLHAHETHFETLPSGILDGAAN